MAVEIQMRPGAVDADAGAGGADAAAVSAADEDQVIFRLLVA